MKKIMRMNRRQFLKNSTLGMGAVSAAGAGLLGSGSLLNAGDQQQGTESSKPLKIKEYRTLGRTGFKVSDISSGYVKDAAVLERLLDTGVNYIDSAESYGNHTMIGQVMKNRDRKSVFITSKLEIDKDVSKEGFLKRARKGLEELQTDYIDCMMIHCPERVELLNTEGFHEAMKQLKNEGRVRFVGLSHHGSNWFRDPEESMEKVLTAAALDGRFDVMLLAYNFIQADNSEKVLRLCKEKNIGTTLMKTNPISAIPRIKDIIKKLETEGKKVPEDYPNMIKRLEAKANQAEAFIKKYRMDDAKRMRDAAIRFVLSNPDVNTTCCAFRSFDDIEAYIPLSGTRLQDMEKEKLEAYKKGCGMFYCRHACGLCEPACPHHVPVNTIMRYNHYFEAQGKEKYAMKQYAGLTAPKADRCAQCKGYCEAACPYGVPVHSMLLIAHHTLTLA